MDTFVNSNLIKYFLDLASEIAGRTGTESHLASDTLFNRASKIEKRYGRGWRRFLAPKRLILFCWVWIPCIVQAGYVELDISASAKRNSISEEEYTFNQSLTGSAAYYFFQGFAVELSYTRGLYVQSTAATNSLPRYRIESDYTLVGTDLIAAWGDKQSAFRPYIKAGMMQVTKIITLKPEGQESSVSVQEPKVVPSAGVGLQLMLSQTFAIKVGLDVWPNEEMSSPNVIWDYATRVGLSWFIL